MKQRTFIAAAVAITLGAAVLMFSLAPDSTDDSAGQPRVSMIIQGVDLDSVAVAVEAAGGEITHELGIIRSVCALLTPDQIESLKRSEGVVRISDNRQAEVAGRPSPASFYPTLIGAAELHEQGVKGKGVTVAVLDTGTWSLAEFNYDTDRTWRAHPQYDAIRDQILGNETVTVTSDQCGHGSHVQGIIHGSGASRDRHYMGVAPDARVIAVRAFDSLGQGSYADVIRGIDWIVQNRELYGIRILNCSFSASAQSCYWEDPLNQAVMAAWHEGIVVVASAGNRGPDPMTIGVPGNIPYVITVGAMTDNFTPEDGTDDYLASFSSTGPTVEGFVKPEIVAPGGHMLSVMPQASTLPSTYPDFFSSGKYFIMSGTSQATAVISGVAALMLQADPSLTPDQVKFRLMASACPAVDDFGDPVYSVLQQGTGMVNAVGAVHSTVTDFANQGLNIELELQDVEHYGGPVNQREDGSFYVMDHDSVDDGTAWDGVYAWSDALSHAYLWSDAHSLAYLWSDSLSRAYLWSDAQGLAYLWSDSLQYAYLWSDALGHAYLWSDGLVEPMSVNVWVPQE